MSEAEMQNKMEFILEQQAQFTVDIQLLRESQSKLTDAVIGVVGIVGKLAMRVEEIAVAQRGVAEAQKLSDVKIAELAVKQAETDARLNIFINVVERYISERRNRRRKRASSDQSDAPASSS